MYHELDASTPVRSQSIVSRFDPAEVPGSASEFSKSFRDFDICSLQPHILPKRHGSIVAIGTGSMFQRYTCTTVRCSRGLRTTSIRRYNNTGAITEEDAVQAPQEEVKPNHVSKFRAKRLSQESYNEIQTLTADGSRPNFRRLPTTAPSTNQGEGYTARADRIAAEYFASHPLVRYSSKRRSEDGPDSSAGAPTSRPEGGPEVRSVRAPDNANAAQSGVRRRIGSGGVGLGGRGRDGERKRDRIGKEGGDEKSEPGKIEHTEAEKAYLNEKELSNKPKEVPHEPTEITLESLIGNGPAIPLGEFGMRDTLTDRMITAARRRPGQFVMLDHLAKRLIDGKFVRFESEEEKAQVIKLVDDMNAEKANKLTDRKGEIVQKEKAGFETIDNESRGQIMEKLFAGRYPAVKAGNNILADTLKTVNRNESYMPDDREKLMRKVTELMRSTDARQERPTSARRD
ncbi:MAG: hypothetical protein M1835_006731 [Candelina submexicana]|nr:MAG: hypothetical protein M1835_006731 [Candelina submexicana]